MKNTCIIICGPTAVGKTSIALNIAKQFSTQIISADSRQCYRELNIAVAKPTVAELGYVHHYFINSHAIQDNLSAADFEQYALSAAGKIFQQNNIAVMVGGTGLYIKAFCEGLDTIPSINEAIRNNIISTYQQEGIGWLQEQLKILDPVYYASGEMQNPQRMMRALEVKLSTGEPISAFQSGNKTARDFNIIKIGLELPREILYSQINGRVDAMIEMGLVEEARSLLPFRNLNALQTVGYRELFSYFDGEISLSKAIELIKQNTRHYAKRQMTWFKKDEAINWLHPDIKIVSDYLKRNLEI